MTEVVEPFVKNSEDVDPTVPPKHEDANSWPLVTPDLGGSDSVAFYLTEIRPEGKALKDVHPNRDHVYYILSGRGKSVIEGEEYEVEKGDALFIPKNSEHSLEVIGKQTLRFVVLFAPASE